MRCRGPENCHSWRKIYSIKIWFMITLGPMFTRFLPTFMQSIPFLYSFVETIFLFSFSIPICFFQPIFAFLPFFSHSFLFSSLPFKHTFCLEKLKTMFFFCDVYQQQPVSAPHYQYTHLFTIAKGAINIYLDLLGCFVCVAEWIERFVWNQLMCIHVPMDSLQEMWRRRLSICCEISKHP